MSIESTISAIKSIFPGFFDTFAVYVDFFDRLVTCVEEKAKFRPGSPKRSAASRAYGNREPAGYGNNMNTLMGAFTGRDIDGGSLYGISAAIQPADTGLQIVGFRQDTVGEVYILNFADHAIHQIVDAPVKKVCYRVRCLMHVSIPEGEL